MAVSPTPVQTESAVRLVPAQQFSIEQLTQAYNQTRVDYVVPMPMNAARLAEYVRTYDVDLSASMVAMDGDEILGLAMLGVRPHAAWITRLGVLPNARRRHIGRTLMDALLTISDERRLPLTVLEVIKNNVPAYNLFVQCGFEAKHEVLVLRRPPGPPAHVPDGDVELLEREDALALLHARSDFETWVTATDSLRHVESLQALRVRLADGSAGWLVFQIQKLRLLPLLLTRFTLHTQTGEPRHVAHALLSFLYMLFPDLDTQVENVAQDETHLPAMQELGFIESFRRIEMHRACPLL
jgi:ribosomal protein S18 acetylase RimI-like enzyme